MSQKYVIGVRVFDDEELVASALVLVPDTFERGDIHMIMGEDVYETDDMNIVVGLQVSTVDENRSQNQLTLGSATVPTFDVHI